MKLLYCVVILSVIISVQTLTLTKEQKAKVKQYKAACLEESKVDPNLVKQARKGEFSDDENLKKFAFCFLRKANFVNTEGKLNEDVIMAKLPPDANRIGARVIMEVCKNTKGTDPADKAYNIYKCYYNTTPTHVSLI